MSVDLDRVERLESQRSSIDSLSVDVEQAREAGHPDADGEELLHLLCRAHRGALARTDVETLFHYACRYAQSRQA